ncbi:MAG: ribosome-associated translation inhibitor RaiA [Chitinophagaceae bacterium]|jgi:putative sigma-54 modulation protein|nr:MAG: ribosome-associated translation inhibitor RaiA [Chitinophagaceae bacterium]
MNTQIQTVHFDADAKLINHVNKRLAKLPGLHDGITHVEVYLRLENLAHQLKDKIAEIKINVPQHQFFVKHESKSFEESFDHAFDALLTQIKREKEKKVQ